MKPRYASVFLALTLAALAGCGEKAIEPDPRQPAAIVAVQSLDGYVEPADAGAEVLIREVYLTDTKVTDEDVKSLQAFNGLQLLDLSGTKITDEGLKHLQGIPTLQVLNLGNTRITDDGLSHLTGLVELRDLTLLETRITDKGLEHLKRLPNLRRLDVYESRITDKGLEAFKSARPEVTVMK